MESKISNNNSVQTKRKCSVKTRSSLIYEGRTHKSHCSDCGKPFAPGEFTIHDIKRYMSYCKPCYNVRKHEYRKIQKKKKSTPKKISKSRANNKVMDLDDFASEIVSIEAFGNITGKRKIFTDLVDDIFDK